MRRLIAALIVLMVAHVVYAEDVPHGVVALPPGGKPIPTPILSHQKVSGVTVRWRWGSVETSDGVYDWSFYDRELPRVAAAGKWVYLKISAGGVNTPAWLMPQVKTFSFIDPATLETLTIPVFWDEAFLTKKFRMISVLGKRFASHPAVRASVVSCANAKTDDWNVPHTRADIQNWKKVGYTTEKLIDVCKTTIAKVAEAFPNQYVVLPVASNNRLDPEPHYVASTVADWALATYPGRFFVARHSLSAITPDPAETMDLNHWSVIYERRPNVAGQMLWSATYDPDCTMNGGVPPCDPAVVLQEAVKIGSRYGLRFVEIYSQDITNPDLKAIIDLASSLY